MSELRYKVCPRYINGQDYAPETARKTESVFVTHEEQTTQDGALYVVGDEVQEDALLTDPAILAAAEKIALAEELEQAILEGGV